jgi:hypothetical protein
VSLQSSEAFGGLLHSGCGPAQGHGRRTPALHVPAYTPHRGHHILYNVGAGERAPKLLRQNSRVMVRISSIPSRIEPETPDQSRLRRWARLRITFSALSASSSSHACRNTRRTEACSDLGNRSLVARLVDLGVVEEVAYTSALCRDQPCDGAHVKAGTAVRSGDLRTGSRVIQRKRSARRAAASRLRLMAAAVR